MSQLSQNGDKKDRRGEGVGRRGGGFTGQGKRGRDNTTLTVQKRNSPVKGNENSKTGALKRIRYRGVGNRKGKQYRWGGGGGRKRS